jgi:hypothetical protein
VCAIRGSHYLLLTLSTVAVGMRLKYSLPLLQGLIPIVVSRILIRSVALMNTILDDSTLPLEVLLHRL